MPCFSEHLRPKGRCITALRLPRFAARVRSTVTYGHCAFQGPGASTAQGAVNLPKVIRLPQVHIATRALWPEAKNAVLVYCTGLLWVAIALGRQPLRHFMDIIFPSLEVFHDVRWD
jgi:hypothetical protein